MNGHIAEKEGKNLKLKYVRGYHRFLQATEGLFKNNPILVCGLALPFAVAPTTSLNSGVALCIAMLITYLPVVVIAAILGKKVPLWLRVVLYPILAAALLIPARMAIRAISPTIFDSLGIYFSLLATSTMLTAGVERSVKLGKVGASVAHGICCSVGFCLVILLMSLFREMYGSGLILGIPIKSIVNKTPSFLLVSFGFILLGLISAFFRILNRAIVSILMQIGKIEKSLANMD